MDRAPRPGVWEAMGLILVGDSDFSMSHALYMTISSLIFQVDLMTIYFPRAGDLN